jgi:hypothetical protein
MKRWVGLSMALALVFSMMTIPAMAQDNCEGDVFLICGDVRDYYNANNGAATFGQPLSNAFSETRFDTDATYITQYFEYARVEHHPGNAGTGYEMQLGRLGDEVLLTHGRDWQDEPKASSSAANYMDATGQAIAPEFWETWRSSGLDLDDTGVSFRESLALFGYPITPAQVETNPAGDDVLTQWFERARFELHDGTVVIAMLGAEILAVPGTGDPEVAASLAQVRQAVAVNHDLDAAQAAGWVLVDGLDHCFNNPGVGAMGVHYINVDLLDLELDPLAPEAMVYQQDEHGNLSFGAVEYIVPAEPWDEQYDHLPHVLGQELHLNEALGVYVLHAWIFLDNPTGVFEDWNPDVVCYGEDASELDDLRAAVADFNDPAAAEAAGWVLVDGLDHCFDNPGVGGMGIHYINVDLLDLELDPLMPEAMVYYYDEDGDLTLGAVEWVVPAEPWDAENDELPEVMGRHLHLNEALGVYVMHAWAFLDNPAGTFEDWNPNIVDCELVDHSH